MFLFFGDDAAPSERAGRAVSDPTLVVLPTAGGGQVLVVLFECDADAPLRVLIPVPSPTGLSYGPRVAAFARKVAGCFPDAVLPPAPAPVGSGSDGSDAEREDAIEHQLDLAIPATPTLLDEEMHHHHGSGGGGSAGGKGRHSTASSSVGGDSIVADDDAAAGGGGGGGEVYASSWKLLATAELPSFVGADAARRLGALYSQPLWGWLAGTVPAGKATVAVAATGARPHPGYLYAPTRCGYGYTAALTSGLDGSCESPDFVRWDTHLVSWGTARRADWAGGGKDPASVLEDMRHRFASGTYKIIKPAEFDWADVRVDPGDAPAELRAMYAGVNSGSGGSGSGAAGSPPPALAMHGRTSLPRSHSDGASTGGGGHGFIAADHAAAAGPAPAAADGSPHRVKRGVSFKGAGAISGGEAGAGAPPSLFGHLAGGGAAPAGATVSPTGLPLVPGVGCIDVLRQKKVALGPDVDVLLMLDYGTGQTPTDE